MRSTVALLLASVLVVACSSAGSSVPTAAPASTAASTSSMASLPTGEVPLEGLEMTPLLDELGVADHVGETGHKILFVGFETGDELGLSYTTPRSETTRHQRWSTVVHSGSWAFTGWLTGEAPTTPEVDGPNHRGYQTAQWERMGLGTCASPCVIDLWVWLDAEFVRGQWFSLATLSLDPSDAWSRVVTVNVGVEGWLHLGHVPVQGAADRLFQRDEPFPMRQWVRVTTYLDARPGGVAVVWQDGRVASVAKVDGVAGGEVPQAHFGLYAPPDLLHGRVVNDDLTVWTLEPS